MAIKPLVLVYQELRSPSVNIINPTLSGCVIGPHYVVRTYEENKTQIFAGLYDVVNGVTIASMPSPVAGMKLKADGFKLYFDNCRIKLASGSAGSVTLGGELTGDSSEDFITKAVKAGDTVKIQHTLNLTGAASGDGSSNPDRISITGLSAHNVVVGDGIAVTGAGYTGTITAVESTYVEITPALANTNIFNDENVAISRTRIVRDASINQTYGVKEVESAASLQMTTNFPFEASGVSYEISRKIDKALIDASHYILDTVDGSLEISPACKAPYGTGEVDVLVYPIDATDATYDQPKIYTEYTALDVRFAHIPAKIEKSADLEANLTVIDYRNPLGLGAAVTFANAAATIYAIGLESEDTAGWLGAIDVVNRNGFYAQALLTQDAATIAAFKNNNVANAAPEIAQYGMCVGNHILPLTVQPAGSNAGSILVDPATTKKTIFEDLTANFLDTANPVYAGDILTVGGEAHVIDRVVSANRVKVMVADEFAATGSSITYTITRDLTKDQQAAAIAATSKSLGYKGCVMTWADKCVIGGRELPGYYLSCAVAGMIAGLPSQAGITNKGVAMIEKVIHSNWDYFTTSQLDTIAAGGTLIFVQDDPASLPYVRHQLTTDPSMIETAEISVVKNNDYLSLFFKKIVKVYLGEWNVTPELISALRIAIGQGIDYQKANKVAKIGAPLIEATVEKLEISSISPDRVEIYISTTQPKPLNTIGLHMIL